MPRPSGRRRAGRRRLRMMVSAIASASAGADAGPAHAALDHRAGEVEVDDLPDRSRRPPAAPRRSPASRPVATPQIAQTRRCTALEQPLVDQVERRRGRGHLAQHEARDQPRLRVEQQEARRCAAPAPPASCAPPPGRRGIVGPPRLLEHRRPSARRSCSAQASAQPLLAAEMVGDRGDVGPRHRRDLARGWSRRSPSRRSRASPPRRSPSGCRPRPSVSRVP